MTNVIVFRVQNIRFQFSILLNVFLNWQFHIIKNTRCNNQIKIEVIKIMIEKLKLKQYIPQVVAIAIFLSLSIIYFNPLLTGKKIKQDDIVSFRGMSKEIVDFRNETGEEALWTNAMFGGMPAFQISVKYSSNLIKKIDSFLKLGLPHPANLLFLNFLGFYILLLVLRVDKWLSIGGAIAFAFSSYFFIIIDLGHNSKANAISYIPLVFSALVLIFNKKYFWGGILFSIFFALEIGANHLQITYYLGFIVFFFLLSKLIFAIKNNEIRAFAKASVIILVASIFAIATNISLLWTSFEYSKETIRNGSVLQYKNVSSTGLEKSHITAWSYGLLETVNTIIPGLTGNSSEENLENCINTNLYVSENEIEIGDKQNKIPLYWGNQPYTGGPNYFGISIFFFFLLGIFILKHKFKYWILLLILLSVLLAWGKNLMILTDFFIDYIPYYEKFRAVTTILIIPQFLIPVFSLLTINQLITNSAFKLKNIRYLTITSAIIAGFIIFLLLFSNYIFDFSSIHDKRQILKFYDYDFLETIKLDRAKLLSNDLLRSLILILVAALSTYLFLNGKIKKSVIIIILTFLFLFDLWTVNRRFLNNENFTDEKNVVEPFEKTIADETILMDEDPNFRVYNKTVATFNEASTSFFHKSIGGYHGAMLSRYNDIVKYHLKKKSKNVFDMLNTKYFILRKGNRYLARKNKSALGNVWFVNFVEFAKNPIEEFEFLDSFNPKTTAIVNEIFEDYISGISSTISGKEFINLTEYMPNFLQYESRSERKHLAVFSEIYYDKGWNAYIDGEEAKIVRANYLLRAIVIPPGNHLIEMKFEPKSFFVGETISLFSSGILILLLLIGIFQGFYKTSLKLN